MPRLTFLSRPMVGLDSLRVPGYTIKSVEMFEEATGKPEKESLKGIRYFEVNPIELSYSLVFTNGISRQGRSLPLNRITDVKVSSVLKGRFTKKEDLVIEMKFLGDDNKRYTVRFDVEDKYADEIVRRIKSSQEAEYDSLLWAHRSLTFTDAYGHKNTVEIYPLAPFLAPGEEIVWYILRHDVNDKKKKIIWIDTVTNYRVFQYSYEQHRGAVVIFPSVEDVKVINEMRASGFGQYVATTSPYLSGIQTAVATGIVGDVVVYSYGQPWLTFTQVSDPETLSIVIRTLNQQHSNTLIIGNGETKQQQGVDQPRIASAEPTTIRQDEQSPVTCIKCGNKNPTGALFCNNCGSPLSSPNCSKCGHTNPSGALFCGQCGSKLQ